MCRRISRPLPFFPLRSSTLLESGSNWKEISIQSIGDVFDALNYLVGAPPKKEGRARR